MKRDPQSSRALWLSATLLLMMICASCTRGAPGDGPVGANPTGRVALDPDALVRFAVDAKPAAWVEPLESDLPLAQLGPGQLVQFGRHVSLHTTQQGLMAVHAETGVLGPVELPERSTWAGVDGRDRIWVGRHEDGALFVADDARVARAASAFRKVYQVDDARAWDVSGDLLAVANESTLHVSEDGGASWREVATGLNMGALLQIYARHDGVLVAQGLQIGANPSGAGAPPLTLISRDAGASWQESRYQPGKLRRQGSWIWSGDPNCVATLAADGVTWSANPSLDALPGRDDPRDAMLALTDRLFAPQPLRALASHTSPPPPEARGPQHEGEVASCQDPIPTASALRRADEEDADGGRGLRSEPCQGAQCLRGFAPKTAGESQHEAYLLADARCGEDDERCARGPVLRGPQVMSWDRRAETMELARLPESCIAERVWNTRGLSVIACRGPRAALWTRSGAVNWRFEQELNSPAEAITAISSARDGTVMLHGACSAQACAPSYLRQPGAAGEAELWAELKVEGALCALPLPGGDALLASAGPDELSSFTLWHVTRGRSIEQLVEVLDVEESARGVELSEDGALRVLLGDELSLTRRAVRGDGALVDP